MRYKGAQMPREITQGKLMEINLEHGFPKLPNILVNAQDLINGIFKSVAGEVLIAGFRVLEDQFADLKYIHVYIPLIIYFLLV
jgi:hypothetical protein